MKLILYNGKRLTKLKLPIKIDGSFWLVDDLNSNNNIINIESANGEWVMKDNVDTKIIYNNAYCNNMTLSPNQFCFLEYNGTKKLLCVEKVFDDTIKFYNIPKATTITLGKSQVSDIIYNNQYVFDNYLSLKYENEIWTIAIQPNSNVYINNCLLDVLSKKLNYGDAIFVLGIKIVLYNSMISINSISNMITLNNKFTLIDLKKDALLENNIPESDSIKEVDYYSDDEYFFKKPRLRRFIDTYDLVVTPPPAKMQKEEMPMILVLGPMLTMAIVSFVSLSNVLIRIFNGSQTLLTALPTLISSCAMLLASLLWPNLTKAYQKRKEKKKEKERQTKYREYIEKKKKELYDLTVEQTQILKENLINLNECKEIILKRKRNLWERRNDQRDFLTVRLGVGKIPLDFKVNLNEEDFVMEEDLLKSEINKVIEDAKMLQNVPVGFSFHNKKVVAIMGKGNELHDFVDNILLQLMSFHSYDDLKIIFLVDKKNIDVWDKYKELPHCFSNNKQIRYFATDIDDVKYISSQLRLDFYKRNVVPEESKVETEVKEVSFKPYYLIITDNYPSIRKVDIVNDILTSTINCGFSMICIENRLGKLPSECTNFISIEGAATILSTELNNYSQQDFSKEIDSNIDIEECCKELANIPIEFVEDTRFLPTSLGFLEMFNVGKVEQLNSINRWKINNPIKSLRAQIGINDESNPIYLDLHEKFHGPHGLIAGTTGSGKSEFIITYILSMALNYSPNEAAFILIDYKGGGLAGAFENKTTGLKLPHLAGTITNLDKAELNRTLVSIESELKRRQTRFNEVREQLGESTVDIYKYQRFFREGKISEPMPHLFIISDEFAELKSQQPDFMDSLISTARIGRSLGIHLILATQKPSGVVNDQIWSNSKFKVCLKVQDRSDSNEMLKKPNAADITNAGRFYLQVGNDEIFVLGQSGWAGTNYIMSDQVKKKYDRSISFIDNVGNVIKNLTETKEVKQTSNNGDELSNVLKYICVSAKKENAFAKNLWLDSIPKNIYVEDIIKKYKKSSQDIVTAVLGEYDAPSRQYQDILTLTLDDEANSLIFGASGTNREMLVASIVYSLCVCYKPEDINIYIVDFGSETLRLYKDFPQVGDIVFSTENDKLGKLLNLIEQDIFSRKKMFADYNGEYKIYCKNSGKKLPIKLIIINNYEAFIEGNLSLEETLVKLTREGERYGICFIISATNGRSIVNRVEKNFHHTFVLNMQERGDYIDVLGKIGNVYPAEVDGRGLFKTDEAYEFQTTQVYNSDELVDFVKKRIKSVELMCTTKAPNVPCLPDTVTLDILDGEINDINNLPIGISKSSLSICKYNFFSDKANIISSKSISETLYLLKTIIHGVRKLNNMVVLIDTEQELSEIGGTVNTYVDKNFEEFILKFEEFLDKEIDGRNLKVLCIIAGLEKFQGSLNEKKFQGFFNGIKTFNNVNLIFVDSSFKLKKIGFETWYSSCVNNINGIWVGTGFVDQTVINCNDYNNRFREKIDNQFAWIAHNGEAELIKIVGENKDEK